MSYPHFITPKLPEFVRFAEANDPETWIHPHIHPVGQVIKDDRPFPDHPDHPYKRYVVFAAQDGGERVHLWLYSHKLAPATEAEYLAGGTLPMSRVFLVACVAEKRTAPSAARDLYCSPWFRKARHYVESTGCPWYILSAQYGLVGPDDHLAPYDKTLTGIRAPQRRAWARNVVRDLVRLLEPDTTVVLLAGERYREFLAPELAARHIPVTVPMQHFAIGEQLRWLTLAANDVA